MGVENNIPEGWVETSIGKVTVVESGGTPSTKNPSYWGDEIPWITPRDLSSFKDVFIEKGERSISIEGLENSSAKLLPKNTILFSSRAPIGYVVIAQNETATNQGFKNLICDEVNSHFKYFYYLMKYKADFIERLSSGSTFSEASGTLIKSIELNLPLLQEQKAIAKVLTSFDDKIELLQAQNKTLETMAQTIFKEWFGKYQIGDELPEGWRVGCLGDVAINHSKTYKFTDKKVVFVNTGDVLEGEFLHKNEISPVGLPGQAKKVIELHDILYSEIRPKNKRFAFVDFDTSNYVVSTKFMIIRTKLDFSTYILYLILKNQVTINEFNTIAESRSGTFPQITFDSIKDFPIVIPSIDAKQKFESILKPIMAKQKVNNNQIQSLTKTRDTLLPKLMSGQVRVNNIKQTADA